MLERRNDISRRLTQLLPPHFDKVLDDQTANVGDSVIFGVAAHGEPQPDIAFYQGGLRLQADTDKVEIYVTIKTKQ